MSCVDNYAGRMAINGICNKHDQIWFESGVSEDALSCHYQIMIPGETACFCCMPPLALVEDNEANIKREGVCAASLPTTMAITAGFLAHTTLKFLLTFEEISYYLQYNARNEYFQKSEFFPNPECKDHNCLLRQEEHKKAGKDFKKARKELIMSQKSNDKSQNTVMKEEIRKEAEEWGLELIEEDEEIKLKEEVKKVDVKDTDVDDLAAQLKAMM